VRKRQAGEAQALQPISLAPADGTRHSGGRHAADETRFIVLGRQARFRGFDAKTVDIKPLY